VNVRARLVLAAAVAVATGIVIASATIFFIVRSELHRHLDSGLHSVAARTTRGRGSGRLDLEVPPGLAGPGWSAQLVGADGTITRDASTTGTLPVTARTLAVARGRSGPALSEADIGGVHVRILATSLVPGVALQVSRPLTEVDDELVRIRLWLLVVTLCGVLLAACIGVLVPRAALTPLERLTQTAEHVSRTGDLRSRIDVHGTDELSRLAATFNTMLAALEQAVQSQRQLVADASHELATPLTSTRTNIEVLLRNDVLDRGDRERLTRGVAEQLGGMSDLVGELVELARGDERPVEREDVSLDVLVDGAIHRIGRDFPQVEVVADLEPVMVLGVPSMIARAVSNLIHNAAKWSPPGRPVEVRLVAGVLTVRDHGPGIGEEDLPRVFDRFYRAREARGAAGSGLGLAIVKQVAEAHGGTVVAGAAPAAGH
jgi:two-component system sensor histidine kinase MprB